MIEESPRSDDRKGIDFKSEIENTIFTGREGGTTEMVFNAATIKCKESLYSGTREAKVSETLTLVPTYKECEVVGARNS